MGSARATRFQSLAQTTSRLEESPKDDQTSKLNLLSALKECSLSRDLKRGEQLHHQAISSGLLLNASVSNSLITMYGKCGRIAQARETFDRMTSRNPVSWTALLQAYVENGESEFALELFKSMEKTSSQSPKARTYLAALSACTSLASDHKKNGDDCEKWFIKGKMIHRKALANNCCDIFVENRLIDLYGKCGKIDEARSVFDQMIRRTAVSWTSLLLGYVENGKSELALDLFSAIDCTPDARTYVAAIAACAASAAKRRDGLNQSHLWLQRGREIHYKAAKNNCCDIYVESSLIDLYAKCGSMDLAREVFEGMKRKNVVSWTALIMGYVENGENETALELLRLMKSCGVSCSSKTYVAALMACGKLMAIETGEALHLEIINRDLERETILANSLIDFYSKCGRMSTAKQVFDSISRKTLVSWTSLMCGYGLQGMNKQVFEVFEKMREQGVAPDEVTFICLLSACSHAGETRRGKEYLESMVNEFGIQPGLKHFVCLVDLMGRASCLEEAMRIIKDLPVEPDVLVWKAILGASRKWGNAPAAKVAYEALMRLNEGEAGAYVMLGNAYKESFVKNKTAGHTTTWVNEASCTVYKFKL